MDRFISLLPFKRLLSGGGEGRSGWRDWEVSNVTGGENWGWVALLIKKSQIKCPSLIQGPATLTLLHSTHLAFHDFFYVSCSFKSERLYSQWQNTEATRGLMERKKGDKIFQERGHWESTRGSSRCRPPDHNWHTLLSSQKRVHGRIHVC